MRTEYALTAERSEPRLTPFTKQGMHECMHFVNFRSRVAFRGALAKRRGVGQGMIHQAMPGSKRLPAYRRVRVMGLELSAYHTKVCLKITHPKRFQHARGNRFGGPVIERQSHFFHSNQSLLPAARRANQAYTLRKFAASHHRSYNKS